MGYFAHESAYIDQGCEIGDGTTVTRSSPVQIGTLTDWSTFGGGRNATAYGMTAIKTDGTLWIWGRNTAGVLGLGNTTSYSSPVQIGHATDWLMAPTANNTTFFIRKAYE